MLARLRRLAATLIYVAIGFLNPAGRVVFAANASAEAVGIMDVVPFEKRLDKAFGEIEKLGISGLVAISHNGGPPIERAFGKARKGGIEPGAIQVDINSITKTVTAAMVLKLVAQGKASLQTRLGELFENVPRDKRDITIDQLLTHAAGFADSLGVDSERIGRDKYLARAFRSRLLSRPGVQYHYSNVGYSVLAAIIERRSGKSYDAFLREDVLNGLGLTDTGYLAAYAEGRALRSRKGQTIRQASWGGHEPCWNLVGNGGMISTPRDFLRFRRAFSEGLIVPRDLVEASQAKHIAEGPEGNSHYGYGLVIEDIPGIGRLYWHDGGNDIFSAKWADYPDRGDILFTAAADGRMGGAVQMMSILQKQLYGVVSE